MAEVPDFIRAANEAADLQRLIEEANQRARLQSMQHGRSSDQFDPAMAPEYMKAMGPLDRFFAGMTAQNRDAWDTLRFAPNDEIRQRQELEAPLTRFGGTPAALGRLSGSVMQGILAQVLLGKVGAAVPGAGPIATSARYMLDPTTVGGNVTAGAVQGALADPLNPTQGAVPGAAGGGFGALAGKGMVAAGTTLKRALDPLREKGQAQILREYMERASGLGADDIARAAQGAQQLVPGSAPTLAEATGNVGLQRITNAARTGKDSGAFAQEYMDRMMAANKARLDKLYALGGGRTPEERAAAVELAKQVRADLTRPLREAVEQSDELVDPTGAIGKIDELLAGPLRKREGAAKVLSKVRKTLYDKVEEQVEVGDEVQTIVRDVPVGDANTLYHGVRKNITDLIEGKAKGLKGSKLDEQTIRDLSRVRDALDEDIGNAVPEYTQYMQAYREASKPIDRLLVGDKIIQKSTSGTAWMDGEPSLRPDSYGAMFKDQGVSTVQQATRFARNEGLPGTMTQSQMDDLMAVKADLDRAAVVAKAGRDVGSPTAELLAAQHVMEGALGPFGNLGMSTPLGRAFTTGLSLPYKLTADEITEKLQRALMDPQFAATLLRSAPNPNAPLPAFLREDFPGLFGRFASGLAVGAP